MRSLFVAQSIRARDGNWVLLAQTVFVTLNGWSSANHFAFPLCQRLLDRTVSPVRGSETHRFATVYRASLVGTSATLKSRASGEAMLNQRQELCSVQLSEWRDYLRR